MGRHNNGDNLTWERYKDEQFNLKSKTAINYKGF